MTDDGGPFDVSVITPDAPMRIVLFAVGGGGDPERHRPLLTRLAAQGSIIVAPHVERLPFAEPSEEHLVTRAARLRLALKIAKRPDLPVVGVGHSIGAATLLALAGGTMWTRRGSIVPTVPEPRLERLVLLAPATGFFQAPGALDAVTAPVTMWAGTLDTVTPPAQADYVQSTLAGRVPVTLHLAEGAGHFSFMDAPPPHLDEPLPDHAHFVANLAEDIARTIEGE